MNINDEHLDDEHLDPSFIVKAYRSLLFPQKAQVEFVKHYLDLKFNSNSDKNAILQMGTIYEETIGKTAPEALVCQDMLERLKGGQSIVPAMRGWFSEDFLLVFNASLKTKNPVDIIERYMVVMDSFKSLISVLWKKISLPFVLLSMTFIMINILGSYVVPALISSVDESNLTLSIKLVNGISQFMLNHGLKSIVFIFILLFIYFYSARNFIGEARDKLDHNIFSIPVQITSAKFFAILSLLLEARMSVKGCLETLHGNMSPYVDDHIRRMLEKTKRGSTNMQQLDTGLLDKKLKIRLKMAGVQNASGNDLALGLISQFAVKDVSSSLLKISITMSMFLWLSLVGMFTIMFNAMFDSIMMVSKFAM
jgi:type II secretory pathway component PulF